MAATVVALSFAVGHLPGRIGYGAPLAVGAGLIALGLLVDGAIQAGHTFRITWVLVAVVIGTGIALCYLLLGAAAVATTAAADLAAVTAINQCARQLGAALGVACAVAAIGRHAHDATHFHLAWVICAAFAAMAALTAAGLGLDRARPHRAQVPRV
jgi:hypothetical protein